MFESERVSVKTLVITAVSFIAITIVLTLAIEAVGAERLRALVESAGPWAPLAYIFARALTFVIAPLSSGPLGFTAGIMFGLWPGLALTLLAELIGGSLNFWIARRLGRPVIQRIIGREGAGRVERFHDYASSPWTLVYARLFFFSVYDFISYAAGLTAIHYRHYVVITLVAGIIPTGISVGIGASLTGNPAQLVVLYVTLALVSAVMLIMYGRIRRLLHPDRLRINGND